MEHLIHMLVELGLAACAAWALHEKNKSQDREIAALKAEHLNCTEQLGSLRVELASLRRRKRK